MRKNQREKKKTTSEQDQDDLPPRQMVSLETLRLSDLDRVKNDNSAKQKCERCGHSRLHFCYDCVRMMPGQWTPRVKLPCQVDVVRCGREKPGKQTGLHVHLVAPEHSAVHTYREKDRSAESNCLSTIDDSLWQSENTVLVFPSPSAVSIADHVRQSGPIERFVVIDCTWGQTFAMTRLPQLKSLPCVCLRDYSTTFWRPQANHDDSHLATIEAIYWALREHETALGREYDGSFDDLLFWFFHTRALVDGKKRNTVVEQSAAGAEE